MTKNARFFAYINGAPVKITLRDGEAVEHTEGGPTEEGWSYTNHLWSFVDGVLTCESATRALDCDGRIDHHHVMRCPQSQIRSGGIDDRHVGVVYPAWHVAKSGQRDYSAEAAGY